LVKGLRPPTGAVDAVNDRGLRECFEVEGGDAALERALEFGLGRVSTFPK
jgi:hypothetical protein